MDYRKIKSQGETDVICQAECVPDFTPDYSA